MIKHSGKTEEAYDEDQAVVNLIDNDMDLQEFDDENPFFATDNDDFFSVGVSDSVKKGRLIHLLLCRVCRCQDRMGMDMCLRDTLLLESTYLCRPGGRGERERLIFRMRLIASRQEVGWS